MSMVQSKRDRGLIGLRYVVLVVLAVFFLLPFYVIVRNAFSDNSTIVAARWQWIPEKFDFSVLQRLFADEQLGILKALGNSAVVSVLQTSLTVFVALLAGYALSRLDNVVGKILTSLTLFTLMVPAAVTFLPTFVMTAQFGWIDSIRGLVIPVMFSAFATYLFRQTFLNFPRELEEAAAIDGANPWTTFWRVVVPNSMGIIGAVGTITFIGSWNAFLWPLLISRSQTPTIQIVLSQFMTSQGVKYPELFAGALVAIVPVVLVFLFLQRFLVQGVETSGIK
ncbi:carbohydrate ABC transporter permease [Aestuariimicrobium ganziense]|uniref:carbohydrate ABC transporter permease n=1 Tax=Aestuariimicrobium ganziense TaxID=2773677 RepID=UPI001F26EA35|nr:carbohydrate ABC transporter permease [Aestuariimicrobium ganziense]